MAPRSTELISEHEPRTRVFLPINRIAQEIPEPDTAPHTAEFAQPARLVKFLCDTPSAMMVAIAGTFTDWQPRAMFQDVTGVWGIVQHLLPGEYEYRLMIDGIWGTDPANPRKCVNRYGAANSVLVVH